jgi:hypothetical protein
MGIRKGQNSPPAVSATTVTGIFCPEVCGDRSNQATALGEVNDPNNKQFYDRDLYAFCFEI